MKKIITGLLLSLTIISTSFAGGGGGYYAPGYGFDVEKTLSLVSSSDVKKIITENYVSIANNAITEDYDYNGKHFYTKKYTLEVAYPTKLESYVSEIFIGLSKNTPPVLYADGVGGGAENSIPTPVTVDTTPTNYIKIPLKKSDLQGGILVDRKDLDSQIKSEFGESFVGKVYLTLFDGTTIPFSSDMYLFLNANSTDGKKAHLTNLYYMDYSYTGYADIATLLKKVFERLQNNRTTSAYISLLEKAITNIEAKTKSIEAAQDTVAESIMKEEDFAKFVKSYGATVERVNLLNDIKYQVGSEIKTKQSESLIEDIFGKD